MSEIENQPTVENIEENNTTVEASIEQPQQEETVNVNNEIENETVNNTIEESQPEVELEEKPEEVSEEKVEEEKPEEKSEEKSEETSEEKPEEKIEENEPSIQEEEETETKQKIEEYDEPVIEEKPKEKFDDSIPLTEEANKDLLIKSNSVESQVLPIEDDVDYNNLSKEELIEKVLYFKDQCKIIKQESDKKIKNTNDYIVRLEEATEQRLDRLRKQNQEDIDEIKQISDQIIKNEKEKAETYVKNMKKSVDDEREVLRQIENDSRSRFQKEKEEKNEALVEVNRLKSMVNKLNIDVEDREAKIQNLEEKNLSVFVQKDKELEQAIIQIENERKHSKEVVTENLLLKEKINELHDELKQYKDESEIRNSQINLLNNDNQQMHKMVAKLTRKNEELTTLYEFKMDEAASLKAQIESLNNKIEHYKRKRHNRMNGMSPLPNGPASAIDPNMSRCFSEMSFISTTEPISSFNKSFSSSSNGILDGLNEEKSPTGNDQLSDISLGYNDKKNKESNPNDSINLNDTANDDGIVTINNITPSATTEVEAIEIDPRDNSQVIINLNGPKPEQRTLVIDTNVAINNNSGNPAFNYQDNSMVVIQEPEEEEEEEENEETIMANMVKPLVFHVNDQTYINFNENLSEDYSKIYNTKLVKQCELEEIGQCLDLNGTYMGFFSKRKLLNGLKNNTVVIEKVNTSGFKELLAQEIIPECALCSLKYTENDLLWYKFFYEDEKNSPELTCMFCRERLVAICNWFKYLSMISKRIIKHDIETIYINCLQLKENMYHARNGLTTDDDNNGALNVVATNPRQEIIAQGATEFAEIEIENNHEIIKKLSFDNSSNADSETLKNASEITDASISSTTGSKKRPSLCYNNTIQKKLSISSAN